MTLILSRYLALNQKLAGQSAFTLFFTSSNIKNYFYLSCFLEVYFMNDKDRLKGTTTVGVTCKDGIVFACFIF